MHPTSTQQSWVTDAQMLPGKKESKMKTIWQEKRNIIQAR